MYSILDKWIIVWYNIIIKYYTKGVVYLIGIYSITNTITNEKYIGEARDVAKRWQQHIKKLELNSHHNYKLQESYNKYGITVFTFNVLEIIPVSNSEAKNYNNELLSILLLIREAYYMKKYSSLNNGFNCTRSFTNDKIFRYAKLIFKNNILNDSLNKNDVLSFLSSDESTEDKIYNETDLQLICDKLPMQPYQDKSHYKNITNKKIDVDNYRPRNEGDNCQQASQTIINNNNEITLNTIMSVLPDFFRMFSTVSIYNILKNERLIYKEEGMKKYDILKENDYLYFNDKHILCVTKKGLRFLKHIVSGASQPLNPCG